MKTENESIMEALKIQQTEEIPNVILDKENQQFEISGRSLPEDTTKFYKPILDWFKSYIEIPNKTTRLELNLEYFNSSSASKIVKILVLLENLLQSGFEVEVVWYYNKDDEVMKERGEEIKSVVEVPFTIKEK